MKRNLKQSLLALMLVFSILVTSISTSATGTSSDSSSDLDSTFTFEDTDDSIIVDDDEFITDGYLVDDTGTVLEDETDADLDLDTPITDEDDLTTDELNETQQEDTTGSDTSNSDADSTPALMQNTAIATYSLTTTVSETPAITVTAIDQVAGTATLTVTNVPSDATMVQIPTWNQSNQSDCKWYTATKSSTNDTTYTLEFDISKHNFYLGTYNAHVYITPSSGSRYYSCATKFEFAETTESITVKQDSATSSTYTISASGIRVSDGYSSLKFAVWSAENNQDDIKWYTASYNTTTNTWNSAIDLSNHKSYGTYYVHAYVTTSSGIFSFTKGITFNVAQDADADISVTTYNDTGSFTITLSNIDAPAGVKTIQVPVWSTSNQSNIIWYTATKQSNGDYVVNSTINKHSNMVGTYSIHVYLTDSCGNRQFLTNSTMTFSTIKTATTITQNSATSSLYSINLTGSVLEEGSSYITYAVWSAENGQDDIKWYKGTEQGYALNTATIDLVNHKSYGTYYVHVYQFNQDGSKSIVSSTTFNVSKTDTTGTVAVTSTTNSSGSFTIKVSGLTASAGVSQVLIPVWSTSNQSNITWYTATLQSDGSYAVSSTLFKHNNMVGTYKVHAYVKDAFGTLTCIGETSMTFTSVPVSVTATTSGSNSSYYNINLTGSVLAEGSSHITYAVWSAEGWQDDLKWYTGSSSSYASNTASINLANHKTYGTYYVHVYEVSSSGTKKIIGSTTFSVSKPTASSVSVTSTNNSSGTFSIKVSGVSSQTGVDQVLIPVWSTSNQSNIVWYTATKQSDGTYTISSSLFKHNNMVGTYKVHAYIKDSYGVLTCVGSTSMTFTSVPISISATDTSGTESTFTVKTTGSVLAEGTSCIKYAVWSATDGQDDIKWYTGSSSAYASNSASVSISNHKTTGTYYVHAYEVYSNGTMKCIGGTTFKVNSTASASSLSVSSINNTDGTFKVTLSGISALSGVSTVRIPVWTTSNQSDIYWYTATKVSSTEYYITVDVANHDYNFGTFNIHAYVTMNNGITSNVKMTTQYYKPSNFLVVTKLKDGSRTLTLMNVPTTVTSVLFPTWSATSGHDDIVWYTGTKQNSTTWTGTVTTTNHISSGTFYTHAYTNGTYVASANYSVSASEVQKNGWYYEGGYKLYYINGVLQTNLDGIYGKQSSYYIEVNRTLCTVTVYAKDGNNGYIIPVRVFACSVGLSSTPTPTGTYTTSDKYRWHTLMGPSYGQYCTRITGGILFHSVAGYNMTSYNLSASAYNKLGEPASHGCVRLTVADAKWIYDYCASGTTVKIFDSSTAGPFPKPATITIPSTQNWDPTDPAI